MPTSNIDILMRVLPDLKPLVCYDAFPLSAWIESTNEILLSIYSFPVFVEVFRVLSGHECEGRHQQLSILAWLKHVLFNNYWQVLNFC